MRWFAWYLLAMTVAGFALHIVLSRISPSAPNLETGQIYWVLNGGKSGRGDYFVTFEWAMVLRFFLAHALAILVLGTVSIVLDGVKRATATRQRSDK